MVDIKIELKLARESINKKDYKEALVHCKNVLKHDKENYNALVFFGVGSTELKDFDRARKAYKKAISFNDKLPLAWQGLVSCLEKSQNAEFKQELIESYFILLNSHISENQKWIETCCKLCDVLKELNRVEEAIEWIKKVIQKCTKADDVAVHWHDIINIFNDMGVTTGFSKSWIDEIMNAYQSLFALSGISVDMMENTCVNYLDFVAKVDVEVSLFNILNQTKEFHQKFPNNTKIFEFLFKFLLYENLENSSFDIKSQHFQNFDLHAERANHEIKCLALAIAEFAGGSVQPALKRLLESAYTVNSPLLWYYVCIGQQKLHQYAATSKSVRNCYHTLSQVSFHETKMTIEKLLFVIEAELYLEQESWSENYANEILKKTCNYQLNNYQTIVKAHVFFQLGDQQNCDEILDRLDKNMFDSSTNCRYLYLKACISINENKLLDAELRLHEALCLFDDSRCHFTLAKVYWHLGKNEQQYFPKAYSSLMKAAMLDSYFASTFVYLGIYQRDFVKDKMKALKCFEKAFTLNRSNKEAGGNLSDLYLELEMEEKAINVYETVISNGDAGQISWACVRCGLIYLKLKNFDKAILCFQKALREQSNISHYWECLAEAYFNKGSYVSALKSFKKSLQLDESSVYSKYMVAKVNQMLSMDKEAITAYKELLEGHPDYVPALLGLGLTYFHLEETMLRDTFDGQAVQYAQSVIDTISCALKKQPQFSCLWKTVGDALSALYLVTEERCKLVVPEFIQKMLAIAINHATKKDILMIAKRCYAAAVKLREDCAIYWHDLAIITHRYYIYVGEQESSDSLQQSLDLVKKALSLDPNNSTIWNTLGVITGFSGNVQKVCGYAIDDKHNPGLSQHAFVKSLQINDQDAIVWANLGILYLKHDKVQAAHEAFKRAQAADPSLPQAWIGQACIAETIADNDAMDLFRHALELKFHCEASTAYGQSVIQLLESIKKKSISLSTFPKPDLSHLPFSMRKVVSNASVALMKYTDRIQHNAFAFNTLGLLLEQECLFKQAEEAFSRARLCLNEPSANDHSEQLRKVLLNQARVLCNLLKFEDAIEIYKICSLSSSLELCQLAYAYYATSKWKESVETYEKALFVSTNSYEKACIHTALGQVFYLLKDVETAKSQFLKSIQMDSSCEFSVMALTSLGLLLGDATLATISIAELSKHKQGCEKFEIKKTLLMSCFYIFQGQLIPAQRQISRAIIRYPMNSLLWCSLSTFLIQHYPSETLLAAKCSKLAENLPPTQMSSMLQALVSLVFPQRDVSLNAVKKYVHSYPHQPESWALLASTCFSLCASDQTDTHQKKYVTGLAHLALTKVDEINQSMKIKTIHNRFDETKMRATMTRLYYWLMKLFVVSHIYYGDVLLAQSFCNQVISSISSDKNLSEDFIFLKGVSLLQVKPGSDNQSCLENIRFLSTITTQNAELWRWKFLSHLYKFYRMPLGAELCYHEIIKLNLRHNCSNLSTFLNICLLALQTFYISKDIDWLNRAQQAIDELLKLTDADPHVIYSRAMLFYTQGNKKAALKYVQKLTSVEDKFIKESQQRLSVAWN